MKLRVNGVCFSYESVMALDDVSFEVNRGEVLGIIGPNGSGKTTLLRCINRALDPERGTILIDAKDILKLDRKEIAKEIGVVPQNSTIHFPFTVLDIVLMGRTPHLGRLNGESTKDLRIARNAMKITNTLHLAERSIDEISGGEKQRIIIARALTQEPRILLLDEPTLHLDINHQLEILELVNDLAKKKGIIVVLVSHDLNLAGRYCNRLVLLNEGSIFSMGRPEEVLTRKNISDVYNIEVEISYNKSIKTNTFIPIAVSKNRSSK